MANTGQRSVRSSREQLLREICLAAESIACCEVNIKCVGVVAGVVRHVGVAWKVLLQPGEGQPRC